MASDARERPPLYLLSALIPLLIWLLRAWLHRWTCDDAFIDFRVVENLLAGFGPVFNIGERVEAFTNPLWVGILAAARLLTVGSVGIEWLAVWLSLACLGVACFAAVEYTREESQAPRLHLGLFVVSAIAGFSDYATSGLESALALAMIALAFVAARRRWRTLPLLVGLVPLVRPDLAIYSAAALVLYVLDARPSRRAIVRLLILSALLPVAYQLFRMAYFAALVPNTALAKEASLPYWSQGARYLLDFLGVYLLSVPLTLWAIVVVAKSRDDDRLIRFVPVAAGLVHWLYVMRVGGDFMHARLLLPGTFAIFLPWSFSHRPRATVTFGVLALSWLAWLIAGFTLLSPRPDHGGIADERAFYTKRAKRENPITLDDYAAYQVVTYGRMLREHSTPGKSPPILLDVIQQQRARLRPGLPWQIVAPHFDVGMYSFAAGPDCYIVDRRGLADPLASRLALETRARPGHEKVLPQSWIWARFADPATLTDPAPQQAARALSCAPLVSLFTAISAPLTFDRALANVRESIALTRLRFSADPARALQTLCARDVE